MKIFCIGLGKTGTSSFKEAMLQLGFNHLWGISLTGLTLYHVDGINSLLPIIERYDSFDDFPWPLLYKDLAKHYPDSKFILTTRINADKWYKSLITHSLRRGATEGHLLAYNCYMPQGHEAQLKDMYSKHNKEVRSYFKCSSNFIELCWEAGHGWYELCNFLDVSAPNITFPHANVSKHFAPEQQIINLLKQKKFGWAVHYANQYPELQSKLYSIILKYVKSTNEYKKLANA